MPRNIPSFAVTDDEAALIAKIAARAEVFDRTRTKTPVLDWTMDVTACHANGTPLDLVALLAADAGNFMHDLYGIRRHLDRTTGKLGDCFLPRCARKIGHLFTPRMPSGSRLDLRISDTDHAKMHRGPWKATITDLKSGKRIKVAGAPCNLPLCFCDAIVIVKGMKTK